MAKKLKNSETKGPEETLFKVFNNREKPKTSEKFLENLLKDVQKDYPEIKLGDEYTWSSCYLYVISKWDDPYFSTLWAQRCIEDAANKIWNLVYKQELSSDDLKRQKKADDLANEKEQAFLKQWF